MASTLYLKSPKRIMALMMVMTLCLLVYTALEHRIREALKQFNETFPNQKGKPVANPTARWVFQFFRPVQLKLARLYPEIDYNEYNEPQGVSMALNRGEPWLRT